MRATWSVQRRKTPSNRRCCWSSVCTDTYGTRNKICSKKPFRDNQGHLENPYDLEPLRSRPSLNFSEIHAGATWSLLGSGSPIRQDFSDYISIPNIDIRTFSIWTYPGQMDIQTQTRDFYPSCNGPFEGFCGSNFSCQFRHKANQCKGKHAIMSWCTAWGLFVTYFHMWPSDCGKSKGYEHIVKLTMCQADIFDTPGQVTLSTSHGFY